MVVPYSQCVIIRLRVYDDMKLVRYTDGKPSVEIYKREKYVSFLFFPFVQLKYAYKTHEIRRFSI